MNRETNEETTIVQNSVDSNNIITKSMEKIHIT